MVVPNLMTETTRAYNVPLRKVVNTAGAIQEQFPFANPPKTYPLAQNELLIYCLRYSKTILARNTTALDA